MSTTVQRGPGAWRGGLQPVDRALYPTAATVEDVGVDHRRLDTLAAQDLLHVRMS